MTLTFTQDGNGLPIPSEMLEAAGIKPGDTFVVRTSDGGILIHSIDPDQAWYWTPEFQDGEREMEADLAAGRRGEVFDSTEEFLAALKAGPPVDRHQ